MTRVFVALSLEKQSRTNEALTWYKDFERDFGDSDDSDALNLLSYARLRLLNASYDDSELRASYVAKLVGSRLELKTFPSDLVSQVALLLLSTDRFDPSTADVRLEEWAKHVAAQNAWGALLKELLLVIGTTRPAGLERVLPTLAASQDPEVAETARLFRLVSNVVAAELGGKPGQARRSLARVPPELRQTVSEYADQIVAAQRKSKASEQAGSPGSPAEGV
jgi:hypothetical protein